MTLWCCPGNTVLHIVLTWTIWDGLFQQLLWLPSIPGAGLLTVNNLYGSFLLYWDLNAAQAPDLLEELTCKCTTSLHCSHTTLPIATLHYKDAIIYQTHTQHYTHTYRNIITIRGRYSAGSHVIIHCRCNRSMEVATMKMWVVVHWENYGFATHKTTVRKEYSWVFNECCGILLYCFSGPTSS